MYNHYLSARRKLKSLFVVENDCELTIQRKKYMCVFNIWAVVVSGSVVGHYWNSEHEILWAANAVFFVLFGVSLLWLFIQKSMPEKLVELSMIVFAIGLLFVDIDRASNGAQTAMPFYILILDMYILLKIESRSVKLLITVMVCWQVILCIERATRIGLFNPHRYTTSYNTRRQDSCCDFPPCSVSWVASLLDGCSITIVFLLDYWFTRGFAKQAEKEKTKMAAVIHVARTMSASLAAFDLDSAEIGLDESGELLPEELYGSFETLLHNLRTYKPYLPKSCFQFSESEEEPSMAGSKSGTFTQSTSFTRTNTEVTGICLSRRPTGVTVKADNPATPLCIPLRKNTISLLLIDLHFDTKAILAQLALPSGGVRVANFQAAHQQLIEGLSIFEAHKGIVEHVTADKITISFNASRGCAPPGPSAAVSALRYYSVVAPGRSSSSSSTVLQGTQSPMYFDQVSSFRTTEIFMSIATGAALCGDLGSHETRKFCIAGPLPQYLYFLSRYSKSLGYTLTCNASTASDVAFSCECAVSLYTMECQLNPSIYIYRILTDSYSVIDKTRPPDEWMYELDALGYSKKWEGYNSSVQSFLRNGDSVAALDILSKSDNADDIVEDYREYLESSKAPPVRLIINDMWQ